MRRGKAGPRLNEPRVAGRNRDRDPGPDERALAGRELDVLARREVEAGIPRVGPVRQQRVGSKPSDSKLDQAVSRFRWASATM